LQTWQSVRQSEETLEQGKSIMMFTVVTIIFVSLLPLREARKLTTCELPLSFLSSVFGMNAVEFGAAGSLSLVSEFKYICGCHDS